MVPETSAVSKNLNSASYLDVFIEKGIIFLLIFTPLAIGTVQQWSIAVMEIITFCIFGAWLLKMQKVESREQRTESGEQRAERRWYLLHALCPLLFAMIFLVIFQIIPLPEQLLTVISPSTINTYKEFMDNAELRWLTISLYPNATREELFKLLSYTAIFFVIINHYRTVEQIKGIVRLVAYMGSFMAIFAIIQNMTWNGSLYWFYPLREGLNPMGPYINRNHFAGYMEMAIPLALGLLVYKSAKIQTLSYLPLVKRIANLLDRKELLPLVFLSLGIVIMSAGVFFSMSRGGITGFMVSVLFFTTMIRTRRSLRKKAVILALLGVTIFLAVVIARWSQIEGRFEEANIHRIDVWKDTVPIVQDFPVFGTGLGTFNNIYPRYQTKYPQLLFDHAHNDYIEILTDTGFVGFIIVAGIVITFFSTVIRRWRIRHNTFAQCIGIGGISSCVAIAVHSFTDFNLHIPANALLLTVIAAITYAAVYNVKERKAHSAESKIVNTKSK
jgi:O-antigen ligase